MIKYIYIYISIHTHGIWTIIGILWCYLWNMDYDIDYDQTWLTETWTIEIAAFPMKPPIYRGFSSQPCLMKPEGGEEPQEISRHLQTVRYLWSNRYDKPPTCLVIEHDVCICVIFLFNFTKSQFVF